MKTRRSLRGRDGIIDNISQQIMLMDGHTVWQTIKRFISERNHSPALDLMGRGKKERGGMNKK